ncbi:MAG TPA: hypothetical protein VEU77_12650 [Candidatus Acidoferrales bacterium]|nr:hypothetical protein [Candidatus Acidoferrales bacterium]
MDALNDDGGQAAILAVVLIALAAVAIAGIREADARLARGSATRWAGEAAVEAAAAVVADAYAAELRARVVPSRSPRPMREVVGAPSVREQAHAAADDLSARNGGVASEDLTVTCANGAVTVAASFGGTTYRASFSAGECSRP